MNRVLKRPMFRIGGSAGTGITSGLDQPRKQYANGSEDYEPIDDETMQRTKTFNRLSTGTYQVF